MPQIVGLLALLLAVSSPIFVILLRKLSRWAELEAHYPLSEAPPANAHRARRQFLSVGRARYPLFGTVAMTDDTLWLGFEAPFSLFSRSIEVPLADVTLYTGEDWASGGARMRFAAAPDLVLTLEGDGAQMLIARLG